LWNGTCAHVEPSFPSPHQLEMCLRCNYINFKLEFESKNKFEILLTDKYVCLIFLFDCLIRKNRTSTSSMTCTILLLIHFIHNSLHKSFFHIFILHLKCANFNSKSYLQKNIRVYQLNRYGLIYETTFFSSFVLA
jgi:hypothetical protein